MDIIDRVRSLLKLPLAIYTILRALYTDYSALLARARAPPGLPVPDPTSAFWQDSPPYPDLVNIQSPDGPPRTADIVIIGSGITAAAIARSLLGELHRKGELVASRDQQERAPKVLVLEARQLCSGATGRNGGHIKASPHELFHQLTTTKKVDPARAAALCAFQISHVRFLKELVQAEGIEHVSEFREVQTVDFAVDDDTCSRITAQMADFTAAYYRHVDKDKSYEMRAHSAEEARALFGVNERVAGALSYPAGALWPYRFVTAVWERLLRQFDGFLAIETGTAVDSVQVTTTDDALEVKMPYLVSTSRGPVRARHVVHATNGFASQLVPALAGKAAGVLCHMTAQRPGANFPKTNGKRSYSVIYGSGFDYITQRPSFGWNDGDDDEGGDELMIGGGLFQSGKQGMDMFGVYDDRKLDAMTLMHLEGVMSTIFDWGAEAGPGKRRLIKAWSGIVGFSGDVLPLVGRLDLRITKRPVQGSRTVHASPKLPVEKTGAGPTVEPGEWIAAYFCGDGMVWAWLCGTALGIMLAGSEHEDLPKVPGRPAGRLADWFPPELLPSWERVQRMDISDLVDEL